MPRNVRNFWIEGTIDGRETPIVGGPRSKDGGMFLNLYIRDNGDIEKALTINCYADGDNLKIIVGDRYNKNGEYIVINSKR